MISEMSMLFQMLQCDAEVTSLLRLPGEIPGDSGVHVTGRAGDVVPKRWDRQYMDLSKLGPAIEALFNVMHPRKDTKPSCLWHDGTGWHFHLQVPFDQAFTDLKGA